MKLPGLTQIARAHRVHFLRYRDGELWYRLQWDSNAGEDLPFDFPIPVADAGAGEFLPDMRGIEVLRWARKHVEYLKASEL